MDNSVITDSADSAAQAAAAPALSQTAIEVLERRYLAKDEEGNLTEDIDGMFRRVAAAVAKADANFGADAKTVIASEERFLELMTSLEFLPNSPTLMNAGRPLGQLSACFVLPVGDSMEEIFDAVKNAALIHKSGGGTGFSFSRLRPAGSPVKTTGGVASGPVSFMRVFNMATEAVKQGGTRRGANMGILRVDHPDVLGFIDCKRDNADITNFNISIGLTEDFMQAALLGGDYQLLNPYNGKSEGSLNAAEVFNRIVDSAWRNGEPGIVFLDRLNRDNVVPGQGDIEATNPCGEQPLLPFESCNLGSIDLSRMLKVDEDGLAAIDWPKLARTVEDAVHFLDNVIEINSYPLPEIEQATLATRKVGLGVMGFADMLLKLGVPYASEEALSLAERVMAFINNVGRRASQRLAEERGAFPLFAESSYAKEGAEPQRNATVTTIAPTGTLSIIAGCSSGVEPVFAYAYLRRIMDGQEFAEANPVLRERLEAEGLASEEMLRRIAEEGSPAHIEELPEEIRRVFQSAHDVAPEYHIRMQAAFQRHTDNAVSKTVNFANSATPADVAEVFKLAYWEGCKGVTIYRDGSRDSQVLSMGISAEADGDEAALAAEEADGLAAAALAVPAAAIPPLPYGEITPRPRPVVTSGFTERMKTGCGNLYVTVNFDENGICEVFTSTGKAGGCPSQSEAAARLASIALRSGISVKEVVNQLKGIRCPSTIRQDGMSCTSCPDAIARVVQKVDKHIREGGPLMASAIEPAPPLRRSYNRAGTDEAEPEAVERPAGPRATVAAASPAAAVNPVAAASPVATCTVATPANPSAAGTCLSTFATEAADAPLPGQIEAFCPDCFSRLEHEGGCAICRNCGYSKCK